MELLVLILFLLAGFYLIGMPIWMFLLQDRINALQRRLQDAGINPKMTPMMPPAPKAAPAPARITTPVAQVQSRSSSMKDQSFEQQVGGHLFQWIGIAALVLALLFFLKWSFDNGLIGPWGRTLIGYVLCIAAGVAGHVLQKKHGPWALTFTGGGVLGIFIVTWIAQHVYGILPIPAAFSVYALTTLATCVLAARYNAVGLAAFGIIGAFLVPMLTGSWDLLSLRLVFVLILDAGVLYLAHVRQWRWLNLLALLGTLLHEIIAVGAWEVSRTAGLCFMAVFLAIYLLVPFVYNLQKKVASSGDDVALLIVNGLGHFALTLLWLGQTANTREALDGPAAAIFGLLFLAFSAEAYRLNKNDTPMVMGGLSLTVLFAALTVPLQFGREWVSLAWSLEGAFLMAAALLLKDTRIQRFAWFVMIPAYLHYLLLPVMGNGLLPLSVHPDGILHFLAWTVMLCILAGAGLSRSDRGNQHVVPFILVGFAVLALTFCMNLGINGRSTLNGIERFVQAAGLIGGGYLALWLASREWTKLSDDERKAFSALGIGVQIVTLVYLTAEFTRAVREGYAMTEIGNRDAFMRVGVSILWALYGTATLVTGLMRKWKVLRLFGIYLLLLTTAKLTLFDFFSLGTGARIIGFFTLGILLVGASFLYQYKKDALKSLWKD